MNVPKEARALLRRRKLARFRWPLETEPRRDGVYALGGGDQFRVIAVAREEDGFSVAALFVDDPLRLLPLRPGGKDDYLDEPSDRIMRDGPVPEPEAVDEDTADRFSAAAKLSRREHFDDLLLAMDEVRQALEDRVREHPELERYVRVQVAGIRNNVMKARQRLGQRKAA